MTFQPGDIVRRKNAHDHTAEVYAVYGDLLWRSIPNHRCGGIDATDDWELVPQPTVEWANDYGYAVFGWWPKIAAADASDASIATDRKGVIRRTTFPDGTVTYEREDGL